jgi:hypothetical protein
MPFGAHIISQLEDALAEGFQYHGGLDAFLQRSGIPEARLSAARQRADERNKQSTRNFTRAPKRFVAQELLKDLGHGTEDDDRLVAGVITALSKGHFPDASAKAKSAIETLKSYQSEERQQAEARREEHRQKEQEQEREHAKALAAKAKAREGFRDLFLQLSQHENPQQRGYMLEKFLNDFLTFEAMNPRGSFKLAGEQIDGSFAWAGRTYLVEAKWVATPVGGVGFSSLMYKIEGKTADTRGLFISINGYSDEAIQGLRGKGELRFVCIDGAHLIRCLTPGLSFSQLLDLIWRHANETGEAYLPVGSTAFLQRSA